MLTIDEFAKVELRVAEVLEAAPHPNADKLLVLKVAVDGEPRQIVAGIRAHYAPEQMVGKQIVIVANLAPARLRGVESHGMLLAASDEDGRLSLVTPERVVNRGAKVR